MPISRRIVLKSLGAASFLPARIGAAEDERLKIAGRVVEVSVTPIGSSIIRISVAAIEGGGRSRSRPTGRSSGSIGARRSSASRRWPSPGWSPAAAPG